MQIMMPHNIVSIAVANVLVFNYMMVLSESCKHLMPWGNVGDAGRMVLACGNIVTTASIRKSYSKVHQGANGLMRLISLISDYGNGIQLRTGIIMVAILMHKHCLACNH